MITFTHMQKNVMHKGRRGKGKSAKREYYRIAETRDVDELLSLLNSIPSKHSGSEFNTPEFNKFIHDSFGDIEVYQYSQRYEVFGISKACAWCGRTGNMMALETTNAGPDAHQFHFNLYHVDEYGKEKMLTKDHIIPVSKGGPSEMSNYRTMCRGCNSIKSDKTDEETRFKYSKTILLQLRDNFFGEYSI